MPIPVVSSMYDFDGSIAPNRLFIEFYVQSLTEDQQKTLQSIVDDHKEACDMVSSSGAPRPEIRLRNVSNESAFRSAVQALDELVEIKRYATTWKDELERSIERPDIEDSCLQQTRLVVRMLERIIKC